MGSAGIHAAAVRADPRQRVLVADVAAREIALRSLPASGLPDVAELESRLAENIGPRMAFFSELFEDDDTLPYPLP